MLVKGIPHCEHRTICRMVVLEVDGSRASVKVSGSLSVCSKRCQLDKDAEIVIKTTASAHVLIDAKSNISMSGETGLFLPANFESFLKRLTDSLFEISVIVVRRK
jgi:hypothetical protein